MSILEFAAGITFIAALTISIIYKAIKNKGTIQWYLKLKSSDTQVDKIIDEIFKNDKLFDELTKIWVSYKNTTLFLKFQVIVLLGGCVFAIMSIIMQFEPNNLKILIYLVYMCLYIYIILHSLNPIILNIFRLPEEKLGGKHTQIHIYRTGYVKSFLFTLFLAFITSIPLLIVSGYIIINSLGPNFNTVLAVYLILTVGMYEYTKRILGFFLPTPSAGIYSTKELIQQISLALNGEKNSLKKIVDETNEMSYSIVPKF